MTDDTDDDPLLALFRAEVRDQAATLTRGLLALDADPSDRGPLAEMAEAAKAVRGAARIMGLAEVAESAAGLERKLTATTPLTRADVAEIQAAVERLGRVDAGEPAADPAGEAAPPEPPAAPAEVSPDPPDVPHFVLPPIDASMLELFREEVRGHAAALSAGLLELERDAANPRRIEPLMRAAHSLKGAFRIVGLDPAVALAHDMEDGFVAAGAGKLAITADGIDTLLKAADLLAGLGTDDPGRWLAAHAADAELLRAAVAAINRGEAPPPKAQGGRLAPRVDEPTRGASRPPSEDPTRSASRPAEAAPPAEAVVRVTAQSLNRLMSLAGESLVQARWLQPFAANLAELKKHLDHAAARLDAAGADPAAAQAVARCRRALAERIADFDDHAGHAEDLNTRLYREVIVSRMRPFADGTHGFPRLVRDTARLLGKPVRLDIVGQSTEVDRDILERLEAPLTHLLRNSVDHGVEPPDARAAAGKPTEGVVRLEARHRGGMLAITVADDGAGIDVERLRKKIADRGLSPADMTARMTEAELLEFLFLPGFSTASKVTEVSGRGVGLDVVLDTVRKVGGTVRVTTVLGQGTTFHLMLPLTLSVVRAVLVDIAGDPYAFPHNRIDRLLRVSRDEVRSLQHRQFVAVGDRNVGLVLASQLMDLAADPPAGDDLPVVLLSDASGTYGLIVDAFRGEQDLVVRPLDPRLGKVPNVSAAAILDDGQPVLIADAEDLIRSMDQFIQTGTLRRADPEAARSAARKRVLVVDDSITVREVQKQILKARGYEVETAVDGQDGWHKVRAEAFDLVVSDVDMPRMTGLEFVRRLRDDAKLKELPVVIVSYKDRDEDRLRGLEAGANYYLTKASFHDDSFVEAVAALIGAP
jgi:two-component system sensor histidine kinase and response regulator WspE